MPIAKAAPGNAAKHREFDHRHRVHDSLEFNHHSFYGNCEFHNHHREVINHLHIHNNREFNNQRHVYANCEFHHHHESPTLADANSRASQPRSGAPAQ